MPRAGKPILSCALLGWVLALAGCELPGAEQMAARESVLAPLFETTSPADAARWMVDRFDADKRMRGTLLIANTPFGGEPEYLRVYVLNLRDPSPNVRAVSARALGLHGSPRHVADVTPLLEDESALVRREAARTLQRLHDPIAIAPLIRTLRLDEDPRVRAQAAGALGQYAQPRSLEALVAALDDEHLVVTMNAMESLQTLTGNDLLSDDRESWAAWLDGVEDPFAGRREYWYPVYQRDLTLLDYLPFTPAVPNELPATPVGMPLRGLEPPEPASVDEDSRSG